MAKKTKTNDPKLDALRARSCLNPRPETVTEPVFTGLPAHHVRVTWRLYHVGGNNDKWQFLDFSHSDDSTFL